MVAEGYYAARDWRGDCGDLFCCTARASAGAIRCGVCESVSGDSGAGGTSCAINIRAFTPTRICSANSTSPQGGGRILFLAGRGGDAYAPTAPPAPLTKHVQRNFNI